MIVWDVGGLREISRCGERQPALHAVAFSPGDGSRLATADSRGAVKLWEPARCNEIVALPGRSVGVFGLAFGPDGRWLATADADGAVRVRDALPLPEPISKGE